jgi:voltage-gated potassium channel
MKQNKLTNFISKIQSKIRAIFDDESLKINTIVEVVLFVVILASVGAIFLEMIATEGSKFSVILNYANNTFLVIFLIEFILRIFAYSSKQHWRKYILTPFFFIDFFCLLPALRFFRSMRILKSARLMRSLRFFKFLRIARVAKLGRYKSNIWALTESVSTFFSMNHLQLIMFSLIIGFIIVGSGLALKTTSPNLTFGDAIWWALIRIVDSGFIENTPPHNFVISVLSLFVTLMGISIFGIFVGLTSNLFMQYFNRLHYKSRNLKIENHFLLCNWGNTSMMRQLIEELHCHGNKAAILCLEDKVSDLDEFVPGTYHFRVGDCTLKEELMHKGAVEKAETIVVFLDKTFNSDSSNSESRTMLTLMVLKELILSGNMNLKKIIIESNSEDLSRWVKLHFETEEITEKIDVTIIEENKLIAQILMQSGVNTYLSSIYSELFTHNGQEIEIIELKEIFSLYPKQFNEVNEIKFCELYKFLVSLNTDKKDRKKLNKICSNIPLPIGVMQKLYNFKVYLNPPSDQLLQKEDKIIILADISKETNATETNYDKKVKIHKINRSPEKLLICGWNQSIEYLVLEAITYGIKKINIIADSNYRFIKSKHIFTVDDDEKEVNILFREENEDELSDNILEDFVEVIFTQADASDHKILGIVEKRVNPDVMIAVADNTNIQNNRFSDARTIKTLFKFNKSDFPVVAEIIEESNRVHAHTAGADSVILSPITIGNYITQVARNKEIKTVFSQLLSVSGKEIYTINCSYKFYGRKFSELFLHLNEEKRLLLIGLIDHQNRVILNPETDIRIESEFRDLIVITKNETFNKHKTKFEEEMEVG